MKIYISKNKETLGPFEREQITQKLNEGEFSLNDFACVEGDKDWQTLGDIFSNTNQSDQTVSETSAKTRQGIQNVDTGSNTTRGTKMNFAFYLIPMLLLIPAYSLCFLRLLFSEVSVEHETNRWALYLGLFSYLLWLIIHIIFTFKAWAAIDAKGGFQNAIVIITPYLLPIPLLFGLAVINLDMRYIYHPLPILVCFVIVNTIWSITLFKVYPNSFNRFLVKKHISNAEPLSTTPYTIYCVSICINAVLIVSFPLGALLSGIVYVVFYFIVIVKTSNAVNSLSNVD